MRSSKAYFVGICFVDVLATGAISNERENKLNTLMLRVTPTCSLLYPHVVIPLSENYTEQAHVLVKRYHLAGSAALFSVSAYTS